MYIEEGEFTEELFAEVCCGPYSQFGEDDIQPAVEVTLISLMVDCDWPE
jgi:hypothetical protein